MSKLQGFTIIELMVSLAILMSLLTLGVPKLIDFIIYMRVDNEISLIQRLLLLTKNSAVNNNTSVTLCPLDDENACINQWHQELSVFVDRNNNKTFEPMLGEVLLATKSAIKKGDVLQYGSRLGLTFASTGFLKGWGQNATFSYCPYKHSEHSRGIIVAISGRTYLSQRNKSGTAHIRRTGAKITCK
jgi:type IV fimbrial biogenesis protein FimT